MPQIMVDGDWMEVDKERDIHEFDEVDEFDEIAPFVGPYFGMFVILVYALPYALTSRLRSVFGESWKGRHGSPPRFGMSGRNQRSFY